MGEERADAHVTEPAGATGGGRGAGKRHMGRTNIYAILAAADGCALAAVADAGDSAHCGTSAQQEGAAGCGLRHNLAGRVVCI